MEKKFLEHHFNLINSIDKESFGNLIDEYIGDYKIEPLFYNQLPSHGKKVSIQTHGENKTIFVTQFSSKLDVIEIIYEVVIFENNGTIPENHPFLKLCDAYFDELIYLLRDKKINIKEDGEKLKLILESKISGHSQNLRKILIQIFEIKSRIESILNNDTISQSHFLGHSYIYFLNVLERKEKDNVSMTLDDLIRLGRIKRVFSGNEENTIQFYIGAISCFPQSPVLHYDLAQLYQQIHQNENAKKEYDICLKIDSNDGDARVGYFSCIENEIAQEKGVTGEIQYNEIKINKYLHIFERLISTNHYNAEILEICATLHYYASKVSCNPSHSESSLKYFKHAYSLNNEDTTFLEKIIELSFGLRYLKQFLEYSKLLFEKNISSYVLWYYLSEYYRSYPRTQELSKFAFTVYEVILGEKDLTFIIPEKDQIIQAVHNQDFHTIFDMYNNKCNSIS